MGASHELQARGFRQPAVDPSIRLLSVLHQHTLPYTLLQPFWRAVVFVHLQFPGAAVPHSSSLRQVLAHVPWGRSRCSPPLTHFSTHPRSIPKQTHLQLGRIILSLLRRNATACTFRIIGHTTRTTRRYQSLPVDPEHLVRTFDYFMGNLCHHSHPSRHKGRLPLRIRVRLFYYSEQSGTEEH